MVDLPAHELKTDRLVLRPCWARDLVRLRALWTEPEVRHWFWDDRVITDEEIESAVRASRRTFAESGIGIWCVHLGDTGEFVGTVGLLTRSHPFFDSEIPGIEEAATEVLLAILPGHRRQGYAVEATRGMLAYASEATGVGDDVFSIADAPNAGSSRVLQRCGMTQAGSLVIEEQTVYIFKSTGETSSSGEEER